MSDPGRAGGVTMAAASGMRAAGRSRVRRRRPAAGTSSTAPARAPPGASRAWERWSARNFRVRGGSRAHGEWRHCATSGRKGCGTGGERYALATFFVSPDCPPPAPPAVRRGGGRREPPPHRGTRPADPRPLRPFPSATPLHPSLYEKRERSEGRRSVGEGKRRGRRPGAAASCPAACRRPGPGQGPRPRAERYRRPSPGPASRRAVTTAVRRCPPRRGRGPHRAGPSHQAVTPGPAAPPASRPHPPAPPTTRPTRARPRTGARRPRCRRRAPRS